jgi:hypothetical protein
MKKNSRLKQILAISLMLLILPDCNFGTASSCAYAIQPIQQSLSGARKKSLEEEATEIEKDFGVKVVREEDGLYCVIPSGEYTNYHYRFRVFLPQGLQGLTVVLPHPHHGFFIRLARNPEARITVYTEFNSAVYESLDEVVAVEVKGSTHQYLDFEITKRKQAKLQDIPAVQLVAQYKDEATGETMMSEQFIVLRQEAEEDSGIIYIFRLDTPKSRYKEDRKRFKQIINSWRRYSEATEIEIKH